MNNLETRSFQLEYVVKNNNANPFFKVLEATKENYSASQTFMHFSVALKTVERSICISPLRTKKK